jgi:hypothetical protein
MSGHGGTGYENRGSICGSMRGGSSGGAMSGGWATLLCGMAAGAALMYFLDPDRGGRRRALLRDKVVGLSNDIGDAATGAARDLRNRAQGIVAEAGSALGMTGMRGGQPDEQEGARQRSSAAGGNAA